MILAALQQFWWDTPSVASRLATFDMGDGVKRPAVFTEFEAPEGCGIPHLCMELDDIKKPDEVRTDWGGRTHQITCRVWGQELGTNRQLRLLSQEMWEQLNKCESLQLPVGVELEKIDVRGPRRVKSDDGFPGYDLQIEVRIKDRRNVQ